MLALPVLCFFFFFFLNFHDFYMKVTVVIQYMYNESRYVAGNFTT